MLNVGASSVHRLVYMARLSNNEGEMIAFNLRVDNYEAAIVWASEILGR